MCGIAGIFNRRSAGTDVSGETLSMREAMTARGPDDSGMFCSPDRSLALGHRRLAIIDLSPEAAQPMKDADAETWIVFNGEIYNYRALRKELSGKGHSFRTDGD